MTKEQSYNLGALLLFIFGASVPAFSSLHVWQNTDMLMGIFVSLWDWIPFFPGQARLGMLVPLLTTWISHPLSNLLAQTLLQLTALFGSLWLLDVLIFSLQGPSGPREISSSRIARVSLSAALMISALQIQIVTATTIYISAAHPYAQGICLMTAAFVWLLYGRWGNGSRVAGFLLLLFLAIWVNESIAAYTLVLLWLGVIPFLPSMPIRKGIVLIALTAAVFALQMLVRRWASAYHAPIPLQWSLPDTLPDAVRFFVKQILDSVAHPPAIALVALLCLAGIVVRARDHRWGMSEWRLVAFWTAATITLLLVALNRHVALNHYGVRYALGSLLIMLLPACVYAGAFLARFLRFPHAGIAAAFLFAALAVGRFGWPSLGRVKTGLYQGIGTHDSDVRKLGCTHIFGSYSFSWTSMFYRMLSDPSHPVYAISDRADTMRARWGSIPEAQRVYCQACGDPDAPFVSSSFRLQMGDVNGKSGIVCSHAPPANNH